MANELGLPLVKRDVSLDTFSDADLLSGGLKGLLDEVSHETIEVDMLE